MRFLQRSWLEAKPVWDTDKTGHTNEHENSGERREERSTDVDQVVPSIVRNVKWNRKEMREGRG